MSPARSAGLTEDTQPYIKCTYCKDNALNLRVIHVRHSAKRTLLQSRGRSTRQNTLFVLQRANDTRAKQEGSYRNQNFHVTVVEVTIRGRETVMTKKMICVCDIVPTQDNLSEPFVFMYSFLHVGKFVFEYNNKQTWIYECGISLHTNQLHVSDPQ